jgi:hypothetical protein
LPPLADAGDQGSLRRNLPANAQDQRPAQRVRCIASSGVSWRLR